MSDAGPVPEMESRTETDYRSLAQEKARKYGVDEHDFIRTMSCESIDFTWNAQSLVKDSNGPNGREPSYGLAQFYIPSVLKTADGRTMTKDLALDPEEALDAAAYNFSVGLQYNWSCYK